MPRNQLSNQRVATTTRTPSGDYQGAAELGSSPVHPANPSLCSSCGMSLSRMPSCSVSTRNPRFRRWIARNRCCRCGPGQVERRTHDYRRPGTTTLFAALNVKTNSSHATPTAPRKPVRVPLTAPSKVTVEIPTVGTDLDDGDRDGPLDDRL